MMNDGNSSDSVATKDRNVEQRDLVSRVKSMWQRDQTPDALAFLGKHSSVRANRSLSLELAYEEYCIRRDNGEQMEVSLFCERFPSISRSLFRQIEVEEYVRNHPSLVGRNVAVNWPRRGDQLFGFVVVEEIGRGAFARVYLCAQPGIGNRQVVVKVSPGGAVEADTMGGLDHPNIMSVYSVQVEQESNLSGICMPFVGRSTLYDIIDVAFGQGNPPSRSGVILEASRALVRRGDRYHQLTHRVQIKPRAPYVTGVMQLVVQIAEALAHAHERGVVHGDLKPSNIVMSVGGMPMLVDFNLSQSRESNNLVTGGTLPYMAPEQIRSMLIGVDETDRVDQRSDVFSLGVICFELLTGRLPFEASEPEAEPIAAAGRMLDAQSNGAPSMRPSTRDLDAKVVALLNRCLSFDAQQRPRDVRVVAQELRRGLTWTRSSRRTLRHNRPLLTAFGASAAAVALAATLWWTQLPPPRDRLYQQGVASYHQEDYASAIESLMGAIAADEEFAAAYLVRGCAEMQCFDLDKYNGRLDAAFRDFTMAVRYGAGADAISARAYCLMQRNEYEVAARDWEHLQRSNINTAAIANNLAYCYQKLVVHAAGNKNRVDQLLLDADKNLRYAQSAAPNLIEPHVNLAILELKRYRMTDGEYLPLDGLEAVKRAIELGANETATYFFAAKLAGVLGDELNDDSLLDLSIGFLEKAVDRGHIIQITAPESAHPFNLLFDSPRYQLLLRRKPGDRRVTVSSRIVVPGVMSSRFSLADETDALRT